jgi:hypothetical protein
MRRFRVGYLALFLGALLALPAIVPHPAIAGDPWGPTVIHPPRECCMGFSYMASHQYVVLYGGLDSTQTSLKAYTWNPSTLSWSQPTLSGDPGYRSSLRTVYDDALNAPLHSGGNVVLFGGQNCTSGSCMPGDTNTWFFDGSNWNPCAFNCSGGPSARTSEGLTYDTEDASNKVVLLFGGDTGGGGDDTTAANPQQDTWILQGTDTTSVGWTQCTSVNGCSGTIPGKRGTPGLEYYPVSGKAIMFGGSTGQNPPNPPVWGDTWRYDQLASANRWQKCTDVGCEPEMQVCGSTVAPPCKRQGHRMVYYTDTSGTHNGIVLFGAAIPSLLNDTWLYLGNPGTWVYCDSAHGCTTTVIPNVRCCVGMTFDSVNNTVVMFGGQAAGKKTYYDVWVWVAQNRPGLSAGWNCVSPTATCNLIG